MENELLKRLRNDLRSADYRLETIRTRLGNAAENARLRGAFAPARRMLEAGTLDALTAQIRLFLLGESCSRETVETAVPSLGAHGACELGILAPYGANFRIKLSLNPVEIPDPCDPAQKLHWWILSDLDDQLRVEAAQPHHVMGVGGATRSLLAQAPLGFPAAQTSVLRALDLGTGCGIVALYMAAAGVSEIVASDISERALEFAQANEILNSRLIQRFGPTSIRFLQGSLFEPVAGQIFDLILSNPPFVITPRRNSSLPNYEYRDGGLTGDALAQSVIQHAPEFLSEGGTLLCMANWETPWGGDGLGRAATWIASSMPTDQEVAGWIIERDRVDPALYAETWIRDGGIRPGTVDFEAHLEAWLADFADRRIVSIGLGSVRVQRLQQLQRAKSSGMRGANVDSHTERIRIDQATGAFDSVPAERLDQIFLLGMTCHELTDTELLEQRWCSAPSLKEMREYEPGSEDPRSITLQIERPIARVITADTLLAAAVGACDGELSLAQISLALAQLLAVDEGAVTEALVSGVRELIWLGMLTLAEQ